MLTSALSASLLSTVSTSIGALGGGCGAHLTLSSLDMILNLRLETPSHLVGCCLRSLWSLGSARVSQHSECLGLQSCSCQHRQTINHQLAHLSALAFSERPGFQLSVIIGLPGSCTFRLGT